jgi:GNAT superfamily N-acetyltransferase
MIRAARPADFLGVMRVLDAANLETDPASVRDRLETGVLVACAGDRIQGALVLSGNEIEAVAVRRSQRDQGLGSALVAAAAARVDGPLTAEFDGAVRAFYERQGFAVERLDGGRFRGVR